MTEYVTLHPGQRVTAVGLLKCPRCDTALFTPAVITKANGPADLELSLPLTPPPVIECLFCVIDCIKNRKGE